MKKLINPEDLLALVITVMLAGLGWAQYMQLQHLKYIERVVYKNNVLLENGVCE